jgi:hypothetical protein
MVSTRHRPTKAIHSTQLLFLGCYTNTSLVYTEINDFFTSAPENPALWGLVRSTMLREERDVVPGFWMAAESSGERVVRFGRRHEQYASR